MPKILIIAGSDPSGGAGIQTDIKVATTHNVYASAVITSLTSQNTEKVTNIYTPDSKILDSQLQIVLQDIKFDAIKVGMVAGGENIEVILHNISKYCKDVPLILDPVMVATSADSLFDEKDLDQLKKLVAISRIVTPNIDEAQKLSQMVIRNNEDILKAAKKIQELGATNVFIKAGHLDQGQEVQNILLDKNFVTNIIANDRLDKGQIHGTGCALATSIACHIAKKENLLPAIKKANQYIFKNIENCQKVGNGSAILTHF